MGEFKGQPPFELDHRPVVLSLFANQGDLSETALNLQGSKVNEIAVSCQSTFHQLSDFCLDSMEAGAYHPDMKLSNFLVHNNWLKISDRKTLVNEKKPMASSLRITPRYAPDEMLKCLNRSKSEYNQLIASVTPIDMPQMMAFELGIALKEFLILTQIDEVSDDDFEKPGSYSSFLFFKSPSNQIINYLYWFRAYS